MEFTQEVRKATDPIYQKISKVMPEIEWSVHAPYIHKINKLKKEKNAVILAHNYQTPEIYHGVADFSADSLALAIEASKTSADIILMAGVHFMAETAKLMSPNKKVILPDMAAGCSLSSSITGKDVRLLKEKYPGVPVVSYVNTSADVKAETDVCCTSANAVKIVKSLGVKKVIFLPDDYLAKYVASQTDVEISINNSNELYKFLLTPKNLRKKISKVDINFTYLFDEKNIKIKSIRIDGKTLEKSKYSFEDILLKENNLQNKIYLKNLLNEVIKNYVG